MSVLLSSCDKHPSQTFFNINISPNCKDSRIKCIQCIYDSDNNDYKNDDYILFQDVKENPLKFIIRTTQSNDLKHFSEIKKNFQGPAMKQISDIEKEFNKICKKFRQKISWCRKNLSRIQDDQEIILKEIINESKVQEIIDNIEDLNYLDGEELLSKIQDINTLTTKLIENQEFKQNMKEQIQQFIDGNHQCICQQANYYNSMKKLQNDLLIKLTDITSDTTVFESWNEYKQQGEQLQKVHIQQDSQIEQEQVNNDQSQQISQQIVQLELQDQQSQISQQQQFQQPMSQISQQSNKQDKKNQKSNNKKNKAQEDIY